MSNSLQILANVIAVAGGGAIGAVSRYLVTQGCQTLWGSSFPWGTAAVNLFGSFVIGILLPFGTSIVSEPVRLFCVVGILGALTTFSTFSSDTVNKMSQGETSQALANVALNLGACLLLTWLGMLVGSPFATPKT